MGHTLTPLVLSSSPDVFAQSFIPWTSLSARSAAGGMHETPNVPAVPTSYQSTRECSQMFSSPTYHFIPHQWSIRLTIQSPQPYHVPLSRSIPSARPSLERSFSPSIITPPNQGSLPPRQGENRLVGKPNLIYPGCLIRMRILNLGAAILDDDWLCSDTDKNSPPIPKNCLLFFFFLLSTTATRKDAALTRHCIPHRPTRSRYNKDLSYCPWSQLFADSQGMGVWTPDTYVHVLYIIIHFSPICGFKTNVPPSAYSEMKRQSGQVHEWRTQPFSVLPTIILIFILISGWAGSWYVLYVLYNTCMHFHACVLWNQMCARIDVTKFLNPVAYMLCTTTKNTTWNKK